MYLRFSSFLIACVIVLGFLALALPVRAQDGPSVYHFGALDNFFSNTDELVCTFPRHVTKLTRMAKPIEDKNFGPKADQWDLLDYMLVLVSQGNLNQACWFLSVAWPPEFPDQDYFRVEFDNFLKSSQYWPRVAAHNRVAEDTSVCGAQGTMVTHHEYGALEIVVSQYPIERENGRRAWRSDLELRNGGQSAFQISGLENPLIDPLRSGPKDITGNGHLDLLVLDRTLDGLCCHKYLVIQVEGEMALVGLFNAGISDAQFFNFDDDPALEVMFHDSIFAGWHRDLKHSPMPVIFQKFDPETGLFRTALDLRKRSDWDLDAAVAEAAIIWQNEQNFSYNSWNTRLVAAMVEMIYAGQLELACQFFRLAWPIQKEGHEDPLVFLDPFVGRMKASDYWADVAAFNGQHPDDPVCGSVAQADFT